MTVMQVDDLINYSINFICLHSIVHQFSQCHDCGYSIIVCVCVCVCVHACTLAIGNIIACSDTKRVFTVVNIVYTVDLS